MSFIKKTMSIFRQILQNGRPYFESVDWISTPKYSGYAVGYGLETIIGPIEIKYSWSPENEYTWFSIGFCFNCNVIQY
jgi:NTE family protein